MCLNGVLLAGWRAYSRGKFIQKMHVAFRLLEYKNNHSILLRLQSIKYPSIYIALNFE